MAGTLGSERVNRLNRASLSRVAIHLIKAQFSSLALVSFFSILQEGICII